LQNVAISAQGFPRSPLDDVTKPSQRNKAARAGTRRQARIAYPRLHHAVVQVEQDPYRAADHNEDQDKSEA
jgi:hypothetical protein